MGVRDSLERAYRTLKLWHDLKSIEKHDLELLEVELKPLFDQALTSVERYVEQMKRRHP